MPFSFMTSAVQPALTADTHVSIGNIVGIITAFLGLLTVIAAVVALVYAKRSARFAADAVKPLTSIASDMNNVALIQAKSLETARQLQLLELLSRRTSILAEIVNTIAIMIWIPTEIEASASIGNRWQESADSRFNQERRKLILALKMLPSIELPKCRAVVNLGHFRGASHDLKLAGEEADQALTHALNELEEEARKTQGGDTDVSSSLAINAFDDQRGQVSRGNDG